MVLPYKTGDNTKKQQVADMFDNISGSYDFLNHFLSAGIDVYWRKRAIAQLKANTPKLILDVATGTGDFAIEALSLAPDKIIGIDISEGMLAIGRKKIRHKGYEGKIELQTGDCENLSFIDNYFDAVIVAFGVRNFEDLDKGLASMFRVLRPGGKLVVLEFSKPKHVVIKHLYNIYFKKILPAIGRLVSKDPRAYAYLPESVQQFPSGEGFVQKLKNQRFTSTKCIPLTFGISSLYVAIK